MSEEMNESQSVGADSTAYIEVDMHSDDEFQYAVGNLRITMHGHYPNETLELLCDHIVAESRRQTLLECAEVCDDKLGRFYDAGEALMYLRDAFRQMAEEIEDV